MDLYEILIDYDQGIKECHHMGMMRIPDDVAKTVDDEDRAVFTSIQKAMTVAIRQDDKCTRIESAIVLFGIGRSYGSEDFTEEDYYNLEKLDFDRLPLNFKARIADVLWIQKNNYKLALVAIEAYIELFDKWFSIDNWPDGVSLIERALTVARSINSDGQKTVVLKNIYQCLQDSLSSNKIVLLLKLLTILINHKYGNPDEYIAMLSDLQSINADQIMRIEKSYELKRLCYQWRKDFVGAENVKIKLAEYYEATAGRQNHNDFRGLTIASDLLKKAYVIYRDKKLRSEEQRVIRELDEIQKARPGLFQKTTYEVDMSEPLQAISKNLEGLTVEESLIFLVMLVQIPNREKIKEEILNDGYFSASFISQELTDKQGRTVSRLMPLDHFNPEKDPDLLERHLYMRASQDEDHNGFLLHFAKQVILEKHHITAEDLKILTKDNCIIPEGREKAFLTALELFFSGKELESIYILIPQVEHMFRYIAKEVGGITTKLMDDSTEEEVGLGDILKIPELVDAYDENLLFTLRGLMVDSAGSNVRNMVAHGLVDLEDTRSGAFIYCVCFIMRILALTSNDCSRILHESKRLSNMISSDKKDQDQHDYE